MSGNGVMEKLVEYVSKAKTTELPPEVLQNTKHHILDTLAAMISGATLKPGEMKADRDGPRPRKGEESPRSQAAAVDGAQLQLVVKAAVIRPGGAEPRL